MANKDRLEKICKRYNVSAENAKYLDNIIVVPVDRNDLYLVFDNNCQILGIEKYDEDKSIKDYFEKKYNPDAVEEDDICLDVMSDSFNSYSLSVIQDISNKCYFAGATKESYCFFNGKMIEDKNLEELISYYALLGKEISYYSQVNLCMQRLGYDVPDIPTYLNSIMEELDYYIEYCISINKRPFESDFITAIGQSNLCINSHIINNIINYSLREKGYEIDYDNNCLKKLDKENDLDISEVSMKLVKLMN